SSQVPGLRPCDRADVADGPEPPRPTSPHVFNLTGQAWLRWPFVDLRSAARTPRHGPARSIIQTPYSPWTRTSAGHVRPSLLHYSPPSTSFCLFNNVPTLGLCGGSADQLEPIGSSFCGSVTVGCSSLECRLGRGAHAQNFVASGAHRS